MTAESTVIDIHSHFVAPESVEAALAAGHTAPALDVIVNTVGTHHVVYGSDYCWTPPALVERQIASLDDGWDLICDIPWRELITRNAKELLARPVLRAD